jgi:luciferase family oxidoreductase group 1
MSLPPRSLLDLFPVPAGGKASQVIHDGVKLAQRAEALGYLRYWIAEHHNMPSIATAAPEVLIAHVAAATRTIRVGAGGIMLPNHTPLRVVEIFRTLEALHPGRIDLGLGRAPGTDPVTAAALRRHGSGEVNEQLAELLAFAGGNFPAGHPFAAIVAMPDDVPLPPIWMLGSTTAGAAIGASLGVGYAFAGHFAMHDAAAALALYRDRFTPGARQNPHAILAVTVIAGEDDEHARRLAAPLRVAIAQAARSGGGPRPPFLPVADALAYRFSQPELHLVDRFMNGAIIGGVATVKHGLEALCEALAPDELMIATMVADPVERLRSYERIAAL